MAGHLHDLRPFEHAHAFADEGLARRERALLQVTIVTLVVMFAELATGWWAHSLALTADGWHMGTHALALGGAVLAYRLSRRAGRDSGYAFGGWKIEVLSAYTSGLLLLAAALGIAWDAFSTLLHAQPIAYGEAIGVAVLGLLVNVGSAWLLARSGGGHDHHGHAHHDHAAHGPHGEHAGHGHQNEKHGEHDQNFRAAYVHVLADAVTSLMAIAALSGGLFFGWAWLDPAVALVGSAVIGQWAYTVLRGSARALVDATADPAISSRIRELVESDQDAQVADLHVWQVGANAWSAAISVVADRPLPAATYRARLRAIEPLRHVTVEVHICCGESRG